MPWKLEKGEGGWFVVRADTGKRMNKKPKSEAAAKTYLAALYANAHDVKELNEEIKKALTIAIKVGNIAGLAKHLSKKYGSDPHFFTKCSGASELKAYDEETRNAICARAHKLVTGIYPGEHKKKEANRFVIFKEKTSGRYRWIAISSNSFQDLDGEIISQKALEEDVARADKDRDFGLLRWWHVKGADLGVCDYNAMVGRMLVESGTFFDEDVAEKLMESAEDFQVSLGFFHSMDEPKDGVYTHIKRFERSILPKGKAANPFTSFAVN